MKMRDSIVTFDAIDMQDRSFVITCGRSAQGLAYSMQMAGLINPPCLMLSEQRNCYRVVCGWLRMKAAAELGWREIPAKIVDAETDERQVFLFSLYDNLSHRIFNFVEKAYAVERLHRFFSDEEIAATYLPLLGLPPTFAALEEMLLILKLEEEIREAIAQGTLAEKNAVKLAAMSQQDRRCLFDLFQSVHLSFSKQAEVIENCADIAGRDGLSPADILKHDDIAKIVNRAALNLSQKGEQIRQWIKKKRFPFLATREEHFLSTLRKLRLPRRAELKHPPFFEGETYQLQIEFETAEALAAAADEAKQLAESPAMHELLKEHA